MDNEKTSVNTTHIQNESGLVYLFSLILLFAWYGGAIITKSYWAILPFYAWWFFIERVMQRIGLL